MNSSIHPHLKQDRLIASLVDAGDLSLSEAAHLQECAACRADRLTMEKEFSSLGDLAERYSPEPDRPAVLHFPKERAWVAWPLGWKASMASAFALLLVISATWYFTGPFKTPAPFQEVANGTTPGDQELMSEINRLSENAIPRSYLYITGEYDKGLSEDFIRFVVPLEDHDAISRQNKKKGHAAC
ncbi:MAG: hypothetical protein AB1659_09335 [Thermodesulfobacteriota bacterium]